jgi:hypothetical protein
MGKVKNEIIDVIDALESTGMDFEKVANQFGMSLTEVIEIAREYGDFENDADPGDMDGDFDSAMTSAGFGTDEDYGYYGENDE